MTPDRRYQRVELRLCPDHLRAAAEVDWPGQDEERSAGRTLLLVISAFLACVGVGAAARLTAGVESPRAPPPGAFSPP